MTHKMHGALIASLSLLALSFGADKTFARSGAAPLPAAPAAAHARGFAPRVGAPFLRHHRGNRIGGAFWPAVGGYYDPSIGGSAPVDLAQPESRELRTTYTYDVPWDWAHRYPPAVIPSDRAYVTECPEQTVTVAGRGGKEQTVNIMRCY
jgi:hypothetical protein